MHHLRTILLGAVVGGLLSAAAWAEEEKTIRPELGKPFQSANELIKQKKFSDALSRLHEADSVRDLTPYERSILGQLRGAAAAGSGDYATAAHAFEQVLASGAVGAAEAQRLTLGITSFYYQAKDYAAAAQWARKSLAEGAGNDQTRLLLAQSLYLSGDYPGAATAFKALIAAQKAANQTPSESSLQLLFDSYERQDDKAGSRTALEELVTFYPKSDYWTSLIQRVTHQPGFPDRLALDVNRLRSAVGLETDAASVIDHGELALAAGLPGEADTIISHGFSAGVLGTGADAERHRRLQASIAKQVASDKLGLAAAEKEAAARPDGTALVNTGLDWSGYGNGDKAIDLIKSGLAKGNLKHPEEAALHLGYAAWLAGKTAQAQEAFAGLATGTGPVSDLAKVWLIAVKQNKSKAG